MDRTEQQRMNRASPVGRWVIGLILVGCCGCDPAQSNFVQANADLPHNAEDKPQDISAQLRQAKLKSGDTELAAKRLRTPTEGEIFAAGLLLTVTKDRISAQEFETLQAKWEAEWAFDPLGLHYEVHDGVIYLAQVGADRPQDEPTCQILRLKLANGQWLSPLKVPTKDAEDQQADQDVLSGEVRHVRIDGDRLYTICHAWVTATKRLVGRTVACFDLTTGKAMWSQHTEYTDKEADRYLKFRWNWYEEPLIDQFAKDRLCVVADKLIVFDHMRDNIFALDSANGEPLWQLPRIWEFRRLYTGSGIYRVDVTRYGMFPLALWSELREMSEEEFQQRYGDDEDARKEYEEKKEQLKQAHEHMERSFGTTKAGPVIVETPDQAQPRVYFSTSFGEGYPWIHRAVEDEQIVYEISANGKVQRMAYVPHGFSSGNWDAWQGKLCWEAGGGQMRLSPSLTGNYFDDKRIDFEYFRPDFQPTEFANMEEFVSARRSQPVTANGVTLRMSGAGFVGESTVCFPITIRNLRNAKARELVLTIPHDGEFGTPESSFGVNGRVEITDHQFFLQQLEIHGDRLSLQLNTAHQDYATEFDLAEVFDTVGATLGNDEG